MMVVLPLTSQTHRLPDDKQAMPFRIACKSAFWCRSEAFSSDMQGKPGIDEACRRALLCYPLDVSLRFRHDDLRRHVGRKNERGLLF